MIGKALLTFSFPIMMLSSQDFTRSVVKLTALEQATLSREIVELDVNIRNMSSMIAMADTHHLIKALGATSGFHTTTSPQYKKALATLRSKLRNKGLLKHLQAIHAQSKRMHAYLNGQKRRSRAVDWVKIERDFARILQSAREFYTKSRIR